MHLKADAFRQYNQAAVIDKFLTGLPEVARAMASPLNNVDKITIVSTGANDGKGFGASQVTADVARMVAQLPELFETLDMKIDRTRADGASAGKRNTGTTIAGNQRTQYQGGRAHGFDQLVGGFRAGELCALDAGAVMGASET